MNLWVLFGGSEFCAKAWGVHRRNIPMGYLVPKAATAGSGEALALPDTAGSRVTAFGGFALEIGRAGRNIGMETAAQHVAGVRMWVGLHTTLLTDRLARLGHQIRVRDHGISLYYGLWLEKVHAFGPLMSLGDYHRNAGEQAVLTSAGGLEDGQAPADYSHSPAVVVSFLSRFLTLNPGDRIALGALCGFTLPAPETGLRLKWSGRSFEASLQIRSPGV